MIVKPDCIVCSINSVLNLFKNDILDKKYQEEVIRQVLKYYSEADYNQLTIEAAKNVQRIIKEITGNPDPYKSLKDKYNNKALGYYAKYKELLKTDIDAKNKAMRLAIAGNIIDFGPTHNFNVDAKIEEVINADFPIDDSQGLFAEISKSKSILYLGDNTGEIVFDKLFLEELNHPNVTFVVRNEPVLNDATLEDVKSIGIDKIVAKAITNGDSAPGTLLKSVSDEFLEYFNNADLVISKGQGNFEGLSSISDKNIYFLLTVKCEEISRAIGVKNGDFVVKSVLKSSALIK